MDFILNDNEFQEQLLILKYIEEKNIIRKIKENEKKIKKKREKNILIEKINTYPIIPKIFNIQKMFLNIKTREDEISFIDELIMVDKLFLKFLFNELLNSFLGMENEIFIKLIHVTKYQTEYPIYNGLKFKLKGGYNSTIFKEFLINYFKNKNKNNTNPYINTNLKNEINIQKILIFSPTLFFSSNFLCNLTKNIIGIKHLWDNIYSFL